MFGNWSGSGQWGLKLVPDWRAIFTTNQAANLFLLIVWAKKIKRGMGLSDLLYSVGDGEKQTETTTIKSHY